MKTLIPTLMLSVSIVRNFVFTASFLLLAWALPVQPAEAASGTLSDLSNDATVNNSLSVTGLTDSYGDVGGISGTQQCLVYMFQIPSSIVNDPTQQFSAATFSIQTGEGSSAGSFGGVGADLYGLGYSNSPNVVGSDYYEGSLDTANTLIQSNFLTPNSPYFTTISNSSTTLVSYLNACLTQARNNGVSSPYVFFRLNPNGYLYWAFYQVGMNEAGGGYVPTLSYTTVTTTSWNTVPLGGGGFVTGLISDSAGDIYARTDCGGALKWNSTTLQWNSITDSLVPTTTVGTGNGYAGPGSNNEYMSISSLAVDPNNTNNLYVSAGDFIGNPGGIFASTNQGATWTEINSTIVMEGQGGSKATGERLAVDPNNSNIVWFGSIENGLYKGVNSSGTWTWTQIPTTSVPVGNTGGDPVGVTFVACDANSGSTIVYAGVYDSVGSTGGIYMSSNGGSTWSRVGGVTFSQPQRGQVAPNGTLYATEYGIVAKLTRGGSLTAITPAGGSGVNYCGLTIDTTDSTYNTLYVAEYNGNYGDNQISRTTNGGGAWTTQSSNFNNYTGNGAPPPASTEPDGTPSLTNGWFEGISSLVINPANHNELFAGTYFGADRTEDAQNLGANGGNGCFWNSVQKNQEQTVVDCLLNAPTGARLMVSSDDIGGFQYLNTQYRPYGSYGTPFNKLWGGSNPGMDFSESNNNVWARTWLNGYGTSGSGAVSTDGGANWVAFGELAEQNITNSGTAGWVTYDVTAYLAAQKAAGTNTVTLALCAGNSISPLYSTSGIAFDTKENGAATAPKLVINGTGTLTDIADAMVYIGAGATNYGSATNMIVSYEYNNYTHWSYIQFDLSSVGSITSATLQLHRQALSDTSTFPVGVYACPNGTTWSESTITWNNRPPLLATNNADPIAYPYYDLGGAQPCGGRIAVSSTNPNNMVWLPQGSGTAAYYSKDRGVTWTACSGAPTSQMSSRDNPSTLLQQLAADRVNGNFYMASFGSGSGGTDAIYSSSNGGVTWTQVGTTGPTAYNSYRAQIVAAPAANDVWVCDDGTGHTPPVGGLWRSTNGGVTWAQVGGSTISQVREVAFGKGTGSSTYSVFISGNVNNVKGVYRSDDYGSTWHALNSVPTDADINALAGDRQNYGVVFIGTNGRGVFQGQ